VPFWKGPIRNPDGSWVTTHVLNQDIAAWVGQGVIADRTKEHLGQSDLGIVMMRRAFERNMKAVEQGEEPMGLVRDEARNRCIELPVKHRELFTTSMSLEESREVGRKLDYRLNQPEYQHQVGQPEAVKREFQIAMGMIAPDAPITVGVRQPSWSDLNTGDQ
jgi:5,5'-dehydrodivanillate O-demethylase